ncbi:hypothetical protein FQN57_002856 [Myotisia sp. PD_48]|nr:hypothetical protein FQN57_002856 [Myotisia sp. PD_48]
MFARRFLAAIGYHHVLMLFVTIGVIFLSVLVAGCTGADVSSIYLLSLSYTNNDTSTRSFHDQTQINPDASTTITGLASRNSTAPPLNLEIRTGYLGMCLKQSSGLWVCARNVESLSTLLKDRQGSPSDLDPLNLIWTAKIFKDQLVFSGLVYDELPVSETINKELVLNILFLRFIPIPLLLIAFLLLSSFPHWTTMTESDDDSTLEVRPFPSATVSRVAAASVSLASVLILIATFWQHVSSSAAATMAENLSYGAVTGHIGVAAMFLGWGALVFGVLAAGGLLSMIVTLHWLSRLVE